MRIEQELKDQQEEEEEESDSDINVMLQCSVCRTTQPYPPSTPSDDLEFVNLYGLHKSSLVGSLYDSNDVDHVRISCELLSVINKKRTECRVTRTDRNGLYKVSYKPHTRGEHRLCIRIDGEHIKGSPFPVVTRVPIETIGKPMIVLDSLERPWGVVVEHDGNIMVSEHDTHAISSCNTEGYKMIFASGRSAGKLNIEAPRGVTVDRSGSVYVVDGKLCCIQKFTSDGNLIANVGKKGKKALEFNSPVGIAVHPTSQKVYVADNANHRIQILNPDFTFFGVFGKCGYGERELNFPWDVAFDSAGNVYVADSWNHRIQVFTENGKHLRQIGRKGKGKGEVAWPSSVCIDAEDFVYIAEAQNHRVSIFTSKGKFVTSFGHKGTASGNFIEPTGIAVDRYRVVYVSDSGNNRLQIF